MLIAASSHPGSSPWSRIRAVGAAAAAVVLLGTAVMAPFSVSNAFAEEPQAMVFDNPNHQEFSAAAAPDPTTDLSLSEIAEETSSGAGSSGSGKGASSKAEYTLEQFMFTGSVNWGGYKFTFYSEQVLPGPGLEIPGRHLNADGYVSDSDGYIVLAGSAPKGTVYETPFGYPGKIYDRGTVGNHLDVYIR